MFPSTEISLESHELVRELLGGDTRALARAISLVENRHPAALPLLRAIFPYTGRATKIGITGPPGVGKSTLAGRIAYEYKRQGHRVAILAVDPSSPFNGGAMLGDRIRMQLPGRDPGIYIRSMATRGHLGGLASAAAEVIDLLDAAGFSRILIESVGAGQDETEITFVSDVLVLTMAPGLGDSVQLLKAGLNEVADIFIVNKCDDPEVERVYEDICAAQELASRHDRWRVPAAFTNAASGDGISSVVKFIEAYLSFLQQTGNSQAKSIEQWQMRILHAVREAINRRLISDELRSRITACAVQVVNENANPYELVQLLAAEVAASAKDSSVGTCQ
jgi:LAO/AO transport system kinase